MVNQHQTHNCSFLRVCCHCCQVTESSGTQGGRPVLLRSAPGVGFLPLHTQTSPTAGIILGHSDESDTALLAVGWSCRVLQTSDRWDGKKAGLSVKRDHQSQCLQRAVQVILLTIVTHLTKVTGALYAQPTDFVGASGKSVGKIHSPWPVWCLVLQTTVSPFKHVLLLWTENFLEDMEWHTS